MVPKLSENKIYLLVLYLFVSFLMFYCCYYHHIIYLNYYFAILDHEMY